MNFPIFHFDFMGNRLLIALIATLHVVISHSMAVGGIPLVTFLEWKGVKTGNLEWDRLARRLLFVFFLITTTFGALTGVGIWFSTSLVNPAAIGSLLRVFFWTWFAEWLIFVTEVVLILIYYLTWKQWSGPRKAAHLKLGFILSISSWITMVLIVAILSFMMDPGNWQTHHTFLSAMSSPVYLPQLLFRTPLAMLMAGAAASIVFAFLKRSHPLRNDLVKLICRWMLFWTPVLGFGAYLYLKVIPTDMVANWATAVSTQEFSAWYELVSFCSIWGLSFLFLFSLYGSLRPDLIWRGVMVVPFIISIGLMGQFERVREFIRKPYAIGGYLYANGIRKEEYPLLQSEGLLKHSPFASVHAVSPSNKIKAGKEVFKIACTRCHTVNGVNSIAGNLKRMYGDSTWSAETISTYVSSMHLARPFMPPFPGNQEERDALAQYLVSLQTTQSPLEGAQTIGITEPEKENE